MGVKFGMEEGTSGPLLRARFHPIGTTSRPCGANNLKNRLLSKLNNRRFALRAMLPVSDWESLGTQQMEAHHSRTRCDVDYWYGCSCMCSLPRQRSGVMTKTTRYRQWSTSVCCSLLKVRLASRGLGRRQRWPFVTPSNAATSTTRTSSMVSSFISSFFSQCLTPSLADL